MPVFSFHIVPGIGRCGPSDERLDKVNPEKTKEVDEGGDEGDNGREFGESDHMERRRIADLVAPAMEEEVGYGEEEGEENAVGQIERER